ncbi:lipopolysaccharide biosynthesis protein [Rhodococcus koreensis]|nr:hypothetical protein [Rhodococcus koreensis]
MVARVADIGVGNNVTRLVAVQQSEGTPFSKFRIGAASVLITSLPVSIICALIYWPITTFVQHRYSSELPRSDIAVLAASCAVFAVTSSVSTILLAILEGLGKLPAKNGILILSNVVGVALAYPLLSRHGALGLGLVYGAIAFSQLLMSVLLLCTYSDLASSDDRTVRTLIGVMWRENAKLGAISLCRLSFEPVTKLLLAITGTLAAVAAFELALRVSTQVRVLVQSALQPLLVAGSRRQGAVSSADTDSLFEKSGWIVIRLSAHMLEIQLIAAPAVCFLGLGYFDTNFLIFFLILIVGNALNSSGQVGYFYQLSSGVMDPLVKIHGYMAIVNVGLGLIGSWLLGAIGAVVAYGFAFAVGGLSCLGFLPARRGSPGYLRHLAAAAGLAGLVRLLFSGVLAFGVLMVADHMNPWVVVCGCLGLCALACSHAAVSLRRAYRVGSSRG